MRGVNDVTLVGHLGRDPETRHAPSGAAVTNISVATTDKWKDKQTGEDRERTEWHRVVMFGRLAEIAAEYLREGSLVYIRGGLQTDKYEKEGGAVHYSTKIKARELRMLGGGKQGGERQAAPKPEPAMPRPAPSTPPAPPEDVFVDDIPF